MARSRPQKKRGGVLPLLAIGPRIPLLFGGEVLPNVAAARADMAVPMLL